MSPFTGRKSIGSLPDGFEGTTLADNTGETLGSTVYEWNPEPPLETAKRR